MALTDEGSTGMVMPVQPMGNGGYSYGMPYAVPTMPMAYGYGGCNNGFFGGDGSWLILFLFAMMFGGGFGGWGMNGGMNGGGAFPWLLASNANSDNLVQGGFNQAATAGTLSGIQSAITSGFGDTQLGIAGVNQGICQIGGQITQAVNNAASQAEIAAGGRHNALTQQLYNNEIANLNRSFAEQTANTAAINGVSSQLAQCCCDNRLATESLRATVLQENCQDRYEAANNARDIIAAQTANTQAILNSNQGLMDKLCALELDGYKRENDNLRTQLNMANLAASQTAQTAQILAGQAAEIDGVYNRLKNCPVGTVPVFGNQPIFTCPTNINNGCGCNGGFAA